MSQKLEPDDKKLYRVVDEVLHYVWDPIGVSGVPQARDEYEDYLPHVFSLLRQGVDEQGIAAYLSEVTTDTIGLPSQPAHDLEVAKILVEWKETIADGIA